MTPPDLLRPALSSREWLPADPAAEGRETVQEQTLSFTVARAHDRQAALWEALAVDADFPNEGNLPAVRGPDRRDNIARPVSRDTQARRR